MREETRDLLKKFEQGDEIDVGDGCWRAWSTAWEKAGCGHPSTPPRNR